MLNHDWTSQSNCLKAKIGVLEVCGAVTIKSSMPIIIMQFRSDIVCSNYPHLQWIVIAACEVGPAESCGCDGASGWRTACFWSWWIREPGTPCGGALREDLATSQCLKTPPCFVKEQPHVCSCFYFCPSDTCRIDKNSSLNRFCEKKLIAFAATVS